MTIRLGDVLRTKEEAVRISKDHFGTVITNNFGWVDSGNTTYIENHYSTLPGGIEAGEFQIGSRMDMAIDELGIRSIRYPGGSEAWRSFEWREQNQVEDRYGLTDWDRLEKVIEYCGIKGLALSFTFPARGVDIENEERLNEVYNFITTNILEKAVEEGVIIDSIKIGNEYHVGQKLGVQQSAEDYGAIADKLSLYIGGAIQDFQNASPPAWWVKPSLLLESGVIWRYGAGDVATLDENGDLSGNGIQDTYDIYSAISRKSAAYVDGVDLHHLNLDIDLDEITGNEPDSANRDWNSMLENMQIIRDRWNNYNSIDRKFDNLEFHSLAWSLPNTNLEGGASLVNAALAIHQFHDFSVAGIEAAYNWTSIGFTPNVLAIPPVGGDVPGDTYLTAGGEVVSAMHESILGKTALEFSTNIDADNYLVHTFADEQAAVVYISGTAANRETVSVDLTDLFGSLYGTAGWQLSSKTFEVETNTNDYKSEVIIESEFFAPVMTGQKFELDLEVSAFSITELVISPVELTQPGEFVDFVLDNGRLLLSHYASPLDALSGGNEENKVLMESGFSAHSERYGSDRSDVISTGDGNNLIYGREGDDVLRGGLGDDFLLGEDGYDRLFGGSGNDVILGGDGNDIITAGVGDDIVHGGRGQDSVELLDGNDIYLDYLEGYFWDKDVVSGGKGDDFLFTGGGDDVLKGGLGSDVLVGGRGDDVLFGGGGADRFIFASASGHDVIEDFKLGTDRLEIERYDFGSEAWQVNPVGFLAANASISGEDLMIRLEPDESSTVVLRGIVDATTAQMLPTDFFGVFKSYTNDQGSNGLPGVPQNEPEMQIALEELWGSSNAVTKEINIFPKATIWPEVETTFELIEPILSNTDTSFFV